MMNALDSDPLESLALRFAGLGLLTVVNNLWTWVAVLAAAGIGFWRTRAPAVTAGPISHTGLSDPPVGYPAEPTSSSGPRSIGEPLVCSDSNCNDECSGIANCVSSGVAAELDSDAPTVTKGKFIVYYENDCVGEEEDHDTATEYSISGRGGCGGDVWWDKWEKMARTKSGVAEWYGYQDLRAIDGSVVRLWDSSRGGGMSVWPARGIAYAC